MDDVKRYDVQGKFESTNGEGISLLNPKMVLEQDYDAKCHAAEVYFGSWKRTDRRGFEMSLDVYLVTNEEGCVFDYNITHNLGKMAAEAGLYEAMWDAVEQGYVYADQIVNRLEQGIIELVCNKEHYESMNPENGWGSYEGLLKFAGKYLNACKQYPTARIEVSR